MIAQLWWRAVSKKHAGLAGPQTGKPFCGGYPLRCLSVQQSV
jgi:hypothetical protein